MASIMEKADEIRRIAVTNLPDGEGMIELGRHRNTRGQQFPHNTGAGHLLDFAYPTQPLINRLDSRIISCHHRSGQVEDPGPARIHLRLSVSRNAHEGHCLT